MSSFIAGRLKDSSKKKSGGLASAPGWRIQAAFFEDEKKEVPAFEIDMELLENGLPRQMVLDLGEFSVVQALREVKPVPPPSC